MKLKLKICKCGPNDGCNWCCGAGFWKELKQRVMEWLWENFGI